MDGLDSETTVRGCLRFGPSSRFDKVHLYFERTFQHMVILLIYTAWVSSTWCGEVSSKWLFTNPLRLVRLTLNATSSASINLRTRMMFISICSTSTKNWRPWCQSRTRKRWILVKDCRFIKSAFLRFALSRFCTRLFINFILNPIIIRFHDFCPRVHLVIFTFAQLYSNLISTVFKFLKLS